MLQAGVARILVIDGHDAMGEGMAVTLEKSRHEVAGGALRRRW